MNDARIRAGKPPLPFLPPVLYRLLGSDSFRDITAGSSGIHHAIPDVDLATGLGTPRLRDT